MGRLPVRQSLTALCCGKAASPETNQTRRQTDFIQRNVKAKGRFQMPESPFWIELRFAYRLLPSSYCHLLLRPRRKDALQRDIKIKREVRHHVVVRLITARRCEPLWGHLRVRVSRYIQVG